MDQVNLCGMDCASFFHVCADGADAKDFIISDIDYRVAFNLVGVCAANSNARVVAFSLEDTHPHFLLYGTEEDCAAFRDSFEQSYKKYVARNRGGLGRMMLNCELIEISSNSHLMNVGTYIINQPTKDGKHVMPYDYKWSSGPLYFRSPDTIPVWRIKNGEIIIPERIDSFNTRERRAILHSRADIPDNWLICDGLILPENYVDKNLFEQIYGTHNCFRTFLSSGKTKDDPVVMAMATARGVSMEDSEIRRLCGDVAKAIFGARDIRILNVEQRLQLALRLRRQYRVSRRQLSLLVRLPLGEVEKYIR